MQREFNEHREWQSFWEQHVCWLRTVLHARLRNSLDADEVLQDVAVLAWRKREQLNDPDKAEPWLYRIAIRQVLMFWRKQNRPAAQSCVQLEPTDTEDQSVPDPARWIAKNEAHSLVRQALQLLCAQDREILLLKHVENWTYEQISHRLGLSYDKVIYRLSRARNRLRKHLASLAKDEVNDEA